MNRDEVEKEKMEMRKMRRVLKESFYELIRGLKEIFSLSGFLVMCAVLTLISSVFLGSYFADNPILCFFIMMSGFFLFIWFLKASIKMMAEEE